mgnify:CR=1 FL=1
MIVVVGDTRSEEFLAILKTLGWGRTFVEKAFVPYEGEPWGFDNGAFRDWIKGRSFSKIRYLKAIEKAVRMADRYHFPYFSVLPDLVAQGEKSLEFSDYWGDKLKTYLGNYFEKMNWYLAVQDGMSFESVEEFIKKHSYLKGIFLGGTDTFKALAPEWSRLAKRYGLKFHYARAGTPKKYALAKLSQADSIDSAFPIWTKARLVDFVKKGEKYYENLIRQKTLF